jgi:[protein-PII] uridylyltransferase
VPEEARAGFLERGEALPALRARAASVDQMVLEVYAATLQAAVPEELALLATGGYGRSELFPCSDVDLLLLAGRPVESPSAREALSHFLRALWDRGLRISQSVRTVEECALLHEGNLELTVSLLDQRFLGGGRALYERLRQRFERFLQAERREIARRLCRATRARHARFQGTIYRLEPDVKETPGGLRDLQTIRWLAALRRAEAWDDAPSRGFLSAARCFLHFHEARDANVLAFELQDALAGAPFSAFRDPAAWMRAYYRHAAAVHEAALHELETCETMDRGLLAGFRDWRARLSNADFTVSRGLLYLKNPSGLEADPALPWRLLLFAARHGVPPARETRRRLAAWSGHARARLERAPPDAAFWKELLMQRHAAGALRVMAGCGILAAVLPEWGRIEQLVVRDFYHHYTVDEHTLVAIGALDRLRESGSGPQSQLKELLLESSGQLWLLRLALLLHDTGKGGGRDHAAGSLRIAREFHARAAMAPEDAAMVEFLVENHLLIPQALQSRDISDPATASWLAAGIKTEERLRLLVLMTFADLGAVNPGAMTHWRASRLVSLYRVVHRRLLGRLAANGTTPEEVYGDLAPELRDFLDGLPGRYLWTHGRETAERHLDLFLRARREGVAVEIERRGGDWRLILVTRDRPFLLASLAGGLASFGLNILQAEAFTNSSGYAVDTFTFADPLRTLELNPPEIGRLSRLMARVARDEIRAEELLRNRPGRKPPAGSAGISPRVGVDGEASSSATIFEITAQDRPGLLYALARTISSAGCNIEVVLAGTEAHKAIDVFHVTKDSRKLDPGLAQSLREALLAACR